MAVRTSGMSRCWRRKASPFGDSRNRHSAETRRRLACEKTFPGSAVDGTPIALLRRRRKRLFR